MKKNKEVDSSIVNQQNKYNEITREKKHSRKEKERN